MAEKGHKLILDTASLNELFFDEACLLGIMAPIPDYQFIWHLNHQLQLDFRINDLEIKLIRKKREYFFKVYEYHRKDSMLEHYLYVNQFEGEYLLPEMKHMDFLWLMKGDEIDPVWLEETMQAVRGTHSVQMVVKLTIEQVKNRENLLF
jgi:hypothetical protein